MKPTVQTIANGTYASTLHAMLRHDLIAGVLTPGKRLRIKDVCERYEVGLSPAREALNRLAAEGFLIQTDHRGFAVAEISRADLMDLTKVRSALNDFALRDSILNGSEEWAEQVVLAFHRMSREPRFDPAGMRRSNPEWDRRHRDFHAALLSGSASTRLAQYCGHLFDQMERYRALAAGLSIRGTMERVAKEHREIMDATLDRNADLACRLLREHLERTSQKLLDNWDSLEGVYSTDHAGAPIQAS